MSDRPHTPPTNGKREGRDLRLLVRAVTPLLVLGLAVGALLDYRRSSQSSLRHFNDKQQYLAQQAADRLAAVFREVDKLLILLSNTRDVATAAPTGARVLSTTVAQLAEHGAISAFRRDTEGKVLLASSTPSPALLEMVRSLPVRGARFDMTVQGPRRYADAPSGWALLACTRINAAVAEGAPQAPAGAVGLVLDWGVLRDQISRVTRFSPDSYSWVLDDRGRLVVHPDHKDHLGKDALNSKEECQQCHSSFELHQRMRRGEAGVGRIRVKDGEEKMVVFTPFAVGSKTWSLAVATPSSMIAAARRRDIFSIFIFTGAIILVMVAGALLLDREASRRLRSVRRFNRLLEEMVAARTEEIAGLYERLSVLQTHHTQLERTAVAGEMASIVAHEVRTPLNALSINAQLISRILRRGGEGNQEKVLKVLGTLEGEIQRINNLLEDHLLALVRRRPPEVGPVCVNTTVLDTVQFMEMEADRHGVELDHKPTRGLPRVEADEAKLRQVLLNLVLNAIQAMAEGGRVRLSTSRREAQVCVTVEDNGPGIPMDPGQELEGIFRPFYTTKKGGTGLGLAICARLVKEMRGTIEVTSEPGRGARFEVCLPTIAEEKPCP